MHIGSNLVPLAQYMIARLYMQAVEDQGRDRAETGLLISVRALNLMCCRGAHPKNSSRCDPQGLHLEKVEGATPQF